MLPRVLVISALAMAACASISEAYSPGSRSPSYSIEVLDRLDAAQAFPGAACIDERGEIAGYLAYQQPPQDRAVVWRGSEPLELPSLDGINAFALSLNARSDIVGATETGQTDPSGGPVRRAVLWTAGGIVELPTLGGQNSIAIGVNDTGIIVGTAETGEVDPQSGQPISHACAWNHGVVRDLGTMGGSSTWAIASNPNGAVIGAGETAEVDPTTGVPIVRSFLITIITGS